MNSPEGQSTPEWITEFQLVIRNYLVHTETSGPSAVAPGLGHRLLCPEIWSGQE